jgi:hypothetical protein
MLRPGRRRVLLRRRHRALVYRGRPVALVAFALLLAGVLTAAGLTGTVLPGAVVAGLLVLGYLAYALHLVRATPAGRGRRGPNPPGGGAGVREPRRPRPYSPAGAAARPLDDEDPAIA